MATKKPETQDITVQLYPDVIRRIKDMAARESTTASALITRRIEREFARGIRIAKKTTRTTT